MAVRVQWRTSTSAQRSPSLTAGRADVGAVVTFTGRVRGGEGVSPR